MTALARIIRPMLFALSAAALLAAPAHAQKSAGASLAPATAAAPQTTSMESTTPATGPSVETASVAVRRLDTETRSNAAAVAGGRPGTALMIVGGAAILVGLVIGNDAGYAISIGGAVVGLIGLYQYLQ